MHSIYLITGDVKAKIWALFDIPECRLWQGSCLLGDYQEVGSARRIGEEVNYYLRVYMSELIGFECAFLICCTVGDA